MVLPLRSLASMTWSASRTTYLYSGLWIVDDWCLSGPESALKYSSIFVRTIWTWSSRLSLSLNAGRGVLVD